MKNFKFYLCLIPIVVFIFATIIIIDINKFSSIKNNSSERNKFEAYLLNTYRNIPEFSKTNDKEENEFDNPELAALQDYFMTIDPYTKSVPKERLITAYHKVLQYNNEKNLKSAPLNWESISSQMGGRTRMIMYDPNDVQHKKVWAGSVTGGLWYNNDITDENSSWHAVNDFWDGLSISSMAYDPNNPQIFYVGTGEAQTALITYRASSGRGLGIWKSTNAGANWQLLPNTHDFAFITDVKVRNESGVSAIYAGVVSGIYEGQQQSNPSDGIYRSTNGGTDWQQVLPNISGYTTPYAPADIDLGSDGRIYVGTMPNLDNHGAATILYSDSGLPGSWSIFNNYVSIIQSDPTYNIPGRTIVACAPSNPNIVYAVISSGNILSANGFKAFFGNYILKSTNKGATWAQKTLPTDLSSGTNWATIAWHALSAAVDHNNPEVLYVGGLDVFKTTNGGTTWLSRLSDWSDMYSGGGPRYVHADVHTIVFKPGSSSEVLFGSDGGVFYTSSGNIAGPVFEQHNMNLSTLQFYTCAMNPGNNTSNYLGGLQDNGTLLYQGTPLTINDMIDGGDGAYCFWDQTEANIYITSVYYNAYSVWYNGVSNYASFNSGTFISPADYDYNTNKLYANAVNYLASPANRILRISNIPTGNNGTYLTLNTNSSVPFSFVKYSPYSPTGTSTLFLGTQSGRLFKVTNAQSTPVVTEIGSNSFPPANLSCVAIGASENNLIATFSNYGVPSVWLTTNGGTNWNNVEGNIPDMPVRWALFSPNDPNFVMLATEMGIWSTDNINAAAVNWVPNNTGLANVRIDMLIYRNSDKKILAATHGRGLFTTTFNSAPTLPVANFSANNTNINIGGSINFTDLSTGSPTSWSWSFPGGTPSTSNIQNPVNIVYNTAGIYDVTLTATNTAGNNTLTKTAYIIVNNTGINEYDENYLSIYPNPSDNGKYSIKINGTVNQKPVIMITDTKGSILNLNNYIQPNTGSFVIDISKYAKGTYYLIYNDGKRKAVKKLIYN